MDDCSVSFARSNQPIDLSVGQTIQAVIPRFRAQCRGCLRKAFRTFTNAGRSLQRLRYFSMPGYGLRTSFFRSSRSTQVNMVSATVNSSPTDKGLICRNFVNVRQKPTKYFGVPRAQALHMGV